MTQPYDPKNPTAPLDPEESGIRTTAWLKLSTHGLIRSYAYHRNRGVSEVVEEALREWIQRTSRNPLRGYNPDTDEFVETQTGEWFPPLPTGTEIRRGKRPKQ